MEKLNKKEWYKKYNELSELDVSEFEPEHQLIMADLWYTLMEFYIWELPKLMYRSWKLEKLEKKFNN